MHVAKEESEGGQGASGSTAQGASIAADIATPVAIKDVATAAASMASNASTHPLASGTRVVFVEQQAAPEQVSSASLHEHQANRTEERVDARQVDAIPQRSVAKRWYAPSVGVSACAPLA